MRLKIPSAAKALVVLTAAGFLLSGCHIHHRAHYGGPHYGPPGHGHYKHHDHGKHRKHGHGHRWRQGGRGWR